MNYTRAEREVSIVWDEEERTAHLYTASQPTMRKLDKLCEAFPDVYKCVWEEAQGGVVTARKYTFPAKYVRFGKPPSEAQKATAKAAGERLRSMAKNPK